MDDARLFSGISHGRTADEVVRQIESLILDGVLSDGDRLPGERDLAEAFDVSRPILREALKELESRGLLSSRHGGGTYVADIVGQVFSEPLTALISRHSRATRDYLEYRRELESMTAALAAERATEADRALLAGIVEDMRKAHADGRPDDEMRADVAFHTAIGEAAHNIILLHTLRACYRLLSEGIVLNRQAVFDNGLSGAALLSQHEAIYAAIAGGDASAARQAAQDHIDYVRQAVDDAERAGERGRVAQLRLLQREKTSAGQGRKRELEPKDS